MKEKMVYFICLLLPVLFFIGGCASNCKNYRDASGTLKTDTRSSDGVKK